MNDDEQRCERCIPSLPCRAESVLYCNSNYNSLVHHRVSHAIAIKGSRRTTTNDDEPVPPDPLLCPARLPALIFQLVAHEMSKAMNRRL
jgi:hypothetical protein